MNTECFSFDPYVFLLAMVAFLSGVRKMSEAFRLKRENSKTSHKETYGSASFEGLIFKASFMFLLSTPYLVDQIGIFHIVSLILFPFSVAIVFVCIVIPAGIFFGYILSKTRVSEDAFNFWIESIWDLIFLPTFPIMIVLILKGIRSNFLSLHTENREPPLKRIAPSILDISLGGLKPNRRIFRRNFWRWFW